MYFPSATIEMIGYLTLTLIASLILRLVEKLMDGSDSYELAQGDQLVMAAGTYSHPDRGTPFDEVNREYTGEEKRNRIRIGLKNRNGSTRGGASTCWKPPAAARSSTTAPMWRAGASTRRNTALMWAWCFSPSTCSTT